MGEMHGWRGLCTFAADYREVIITVHTVWSLVTQRKKQTYFCEDIFVVCGIRRFDDNSVLILRPQSRISWIISPQCIIIIGVVVFVTATLTRSSVSARLGSQDNCGQGLSLSQCPGSR